jgi:phage tail sheath protein FI
MTYPGVYIHELPGDRGISGVATSITAFIGRAASGPVNDPVTITGFLDFEGGFGGLGLDHPMSYAVRDFFANGGTKAVVIRLSSDIGGSFSEALSALDGVDLFNLLCIPPDTRAGTTLQAVYQAALTSCVARRAMLIVDPPAGWTSADAARDGLDGDIALTGLAARNAALYFPRLRQADPLLKGQLDSFVPCGAVAGVMARTDAQRGVWKAPAGANALLQGTEDLSVPVTDAENGILNPLGVNCLRRFPNAGPVVWAARTLRGADRFADEYKYIPVRRLALFLEESIGRGIRWAVFEPNGEPLWAQLRLHVGTFMHGLFVRGAFQGSSPRDAYFVKVDGDTTPQNDIDAGIVNILVGFAPLKPAEFVILRFQQRANRSGRPPG